MQWHRVGFHARRPRVVLGFGWPLATVVGAPDIFSTDEGRLLPSSVSVVRRGSLEFTHKQQHHNALV